jgi:hypothetical protein
MEQIMDSRLKLNNIFFFLFAPAHLVSSSLAKPKAPMALLRKQLAGSMAERFKALAC